MSDNSRDKQGLKQTLTLNDWICVANLAAALLQFLLPERVTERGVNKSEGRVTRVTSVPRSTGAFGSSALARARALACLVDGHIVVKYSQQTSGELSSDADHINVH